MKFIHSFTSFLKNHVNLNQTRVDKAAQTFDAISSFLENADETSSFFMSTAKQGSLRQGTIIKPRTDDTEFDVDLLLRLEAQADWEPVNYLSVVRDAFAASDRYKDMVDDDPNIHRCVTIDYEGDFHLDVVPSIEVDGQCWIMNGDTNKLEPTDGDGYAEWFAGQNAKTGGQLVRVVRLVKYLRDQHKLPVKSILLTTLLGQQVQSTDTAANYPDVPTALLLLLERLDKWLQEQAEMPVIANPALPEELFVRHWNEAVFNECRDKVARVTALVRQAYDAIDDDDAATHWRFAFGDNFPVLDEDLDGGEALVLATFETGALAPHARPVTDIATTQNVTNTAHIKAWVYNKYGKILFKGLASDGKVSSGRSIQFKVGTNAVEPYEVHWQVVNTGPHAAGAGPAGLRGGFQAGRNLENKAIEKHRNWEATKYTGRHWIEAFIVKNGVCVARDRFYVRIKNKLF